MITIYPLKGFRFPIITENFTPDFLQGKTIKEIEELKLWEGNKQRKLGELFKVEETRTEASQNSVALTIRGDVSKVRRIGTGMKSGEILIYGNVGMHLGEEMKSGNITVHGNAGGWAGSMMKGGTIEIHGNADDYLGGPYRGSTEGMRGGKITVYGNVGNEAGTHMRKGMIKIYGSAGEFAGFRMHNGTIYIRNDSDGRPGAGMTNGKIVIGGAVESVLPTFTIDSVKEKVKIEEGETVQGPFYVFLGDLVEKGSGKLYVSKPKNPHLSRFERLL